MLTLSSVCPALLLRGRSVMAARNCPHWPYYLMALNINFILAYSIFEGLLSFVSNTVQSFWFLCTQGLHFWPDTWSRPVFFIPLVCWDHGTKAKGGSFWEGSADSQWDSNGASWPLAVHNTKKNQTQGFSKAATVIWMV